MQRKFPTGLFDLSLRVRVSVILENSLVGILLPRSKKTQRTRGVV